MRGQLLWHAKVHSQTDQHPLSCRTGTGKETDVPSQEIPGLREQSIF